MLVALSMSIRTSHPTLPHPSIPPLPQGRLPIYILLVLFNHRCPRPDVVMGGWGTKNEKKKLTYEGGGLKTVAVKKSFSMWAGKMRQKHLKM